MNTMMKCGHAANAVLADGSGPVCLVCFGINPGAADVDDAPLLIGRQARCVCGKTKLSDVDLPFFEYRGAGSARAGRMCKHCPYTLVAHGEINTFTGRPGITDHAFVPHGPYEFDGFYDGCRGWN